ncbi:peptidylprolyl isomerase [Schaalia sp. 19OD2882]|uniref:FKBP-type peptidyl-prolyl cis-trans isomerase n=1 Tax=Schaalia sp. 19OD2882 TaxID=2794089 RepID=UPI001C1ED05E|nr:peptidylprolyl isomerase [Schaalia sp. 19OD2882]QWW18720.1 peptidylprolyl isomerase [Schaalia sp. 19OD2882]
MSPSRNSAEHRATSTTGEQGKRGGRPVLLIALVLVLLVSVAATYVLLQGDYFAESVVSGPQSDTTQSEATSVFDLIEVSGRVGATPVVSVSGPVRVSGAKRTIVTPGAGRTITRGSPVLVAVSVFDGKDGSTLSPGGVPQLSVGMATEDSIGADLARAVTGQKEGTRLLYARAVAQGAAATSTASDVEIDVVDILPSVAVGVAPENAGAGPLQVTLGDEGPVIKHGNPVPTAVTVQPLLIGDGAQVGVDDRLVVQYIVTGWKDGVVRDSTWTTGLPKVLRMADAMPGLRRALVDQRIGSRLAVTVPPDLATGDDTLCIVIDILGAQPQVAATDQAASAGQSGREVDASSSASP